MLLCVYRPASIYAIKADHIVLLKMFGNVYQLIKQVFVFEIKQFRAIQFFHKTSLV